MAVTITATVDTTLNPGAVVALANLPSNIVVDWGDGTTPAAGNTHTYATDGVYEVLIHDYSTIGTGYLFQNVGVLTSIIFGDTCNINTSAYNDGYMLAGCQNLKHIVLGNGFTNIGGHFAFNAKSLETVEFGSGLNELNAYMFTQYLGINSLTKIIFHSMKQFVTMSKDAASNIPWGNLPNAYLYINDQKIEDLIMPDDITNISKYAFYGYKKLKSVVFPETLKTIGIRAFEYCDNLRYIQIGSGVSTIPQNCFSVISSSDTDITFGPSITSIASNAFSSRPANKSNIYYTGTQSEWQTLLTNVSSGNAAITSGTLHLVRTVNWHPGVGTLDPSVPNPSYLDVLPTPMPSVTVSGGWIASNWYYDPSFTNLAAPGTTLTSNVDLYVKLYNTITYALDGGINSALNPDEYTSLDVEHAKLLHAPMKAGYDFDGWYLDSGFTTPVEDMSEFDGSAITLYAKFVDHYYNVPMEKTPTGTLPAHMDAYTVRGHDAFINVNLSTLTTMEELYIKINDINARNEHAYFDMSSYVPGAYVCLISMQDLVGVHYCEINDLLHNRVYYAYDGFTFTEDIDEYVERCLVKDNYVSVKVSGLSNMGELVDYIDKINTNGDHAFFDFSDYITGAYVCTVQCFQQSSVNYCFIFDILGGKLYGRYTGYTDIETITAYVTSSTAESDIVHAIRITDTTMTLQQVIQLLNKVNQIGHHVFFDVSAISSTDYLITFTIEESGSNTTCTAIGLVKGTAAKKTYATADLATTTLSSFLATGSAIVNQNELNNFIVQVIQS